MSTVAFEIQMYSQLLLLHNQNIPVVLRQHFSLWEIPDISQLSAVPALADYPKQRALCFAPSLEQVQIRNSLFCTMSDIFFPLIADKIFGEFCDFNPLTQALRTLCGFAEPRDLATTS